MAPAEAKSEHGFSVLVLRSPAVEVSVVPELGAKVVSLRSLVTGREWMWRCEPSRSLFRNRLGDDFAASPLVGWDECLPTIAGCRWQGRDLPDHGEAWSTAWTVDAAAWASGTIRTTVHLPISPLSLTRSLRVEDNSVIADYALTSRSGEPERFIWAMHPVLSLRPGDRLVLPTGVKPQESWFRSLDFDQANGCGKSFLRWNEPSLFARATLANDLTGDRLTFEWAARENDTVGLWLTRGGWHGHHHFAIEPTNAAHDSLATAAIDLNHCGTISPGATKTWRVRLTLNAQN